MKSTQGVKIDFHEHRGYSYVHVGSSSELSCDHLFFDQEKNGR